MHREEKRAKTRARLIEAALNVFAFGGYEHATVDDIAHAAGLSKGAFYFNFNSKEEILIELLRQWSGERASALSTAAQAAAEPTARFPSMAAALIAYGGGTNWPPLILEFWSQALRAGAVDRALKQAYRDFRTTLAGAAAETANGRDAGETADAILAVHDGAVTEIALGRARSSAGAAPGLAAMVAGGVGRDARPVAEAAGA